MQADALSPLKLFDYLASGCVPVCSQSQPMHEVLDGKGAGLVGDWTGKSLCDALMALHCNRQRLQQMRAVGRQIIVQDYSWRRIAAKTVEIIESVRR
jgi:glycosyltransferase involved in cell wall biosynthesis